jgi:hypothetical protein
MMYYCQYSDNRNPCYPSMCKNLDCDHRADELERYTKAKHLVFERRLDWCTQWCTMPCSFPGGILCDEEIERLRDERLTIEQIIGDERSNPKGVISLQAERVKRLRRKNWW